VPDDLAAIIMSLLDKDPDKRPADARAVQARLMACADYGRWDRDDAKRWWTQINAERVEPA
jgi:hypothetical protein